MSRSTAVLLTLALLVASLAVPVAAASTQTTAEDGGTYEIGATLTFDVGDHDEAYSLRTAADDLFVNAIQSENGTVTVDTDSMDPGTYVLIDQRAEAVAFEFTLVVDRTATSTPTATRTPTATATTPEPTTIAADADAPGFGPVAALVAVAGLVALGRAR